jgi:hypothetical protein
MNKKKFSDSQWLDLEESYEEFFKRISGYDLVPGNLYNKDP